MGGALTIGLHAGEECGCLSGEFVESAYTSVMSADLVGGVICLGAMGAVIYDYAVQESEDVTIAVMEIHMEMVRNNQNNPDFN